MKNKITTSVLILLVAFISTSAILITEACDVTALKAALKRELRPDYKYDSSKTNQFTYTAKKQVWEIEVPLFMGERYRFLFNTAGMPTDVDVKIYNKKSSNPKRAVIYDLELIEGQTVYTFEPKKSKKMYITYIVPASTEANLTGCMAFVLGYNLGALKALD